MRRKLRVDRARRGKRLTGAGKIRNIRMYLACKYGIAFKSLLLGKLDFRIPIRSFHEAHRNLAATIITQVLQKAQHIACAALIGLECQTEAVPTVEAAIPVHGLENIQRKLKSVGLFRIDSDTDAGIPRLNCQLRDTRH